MEATISSLSVESDKHPSNTSETSESSVPSKTARRTRQTQRASRKEMEDLTDRVKNQYLRNKKTYDKLLSINPYFSMKLYTPASRGNDQNCESSKVSAMIKEIELLLDDGRVLQKEIMKAQLRQMKKQHQQYTENNEWKDHYAYIRKIWINHDECQSGQSIDTIEQLNKKVVMVKNNLFSMMAQEKQSYTAKPSSNEQYETVSRKIEDMAHNTEVYRLLQEKYENLRMAYEDLSQKLSSKVEEMNMKVGQRNEVIRQIKYDNEELKRANKQLKEKLIGSQSKEALLLSKIKDIESEKKIKAVSQVVVQSPKTQLKSSDLNFETIKFQKIQNKELLLSVKELNISQKSLPSTIKQQQNDKSFMSPECKKDSEENINSLNESYIQNRRNQLCDAKSIDGKRGRFVRMRSPVAGKLHKTNEGELMERLRGDVGSPVPKRRAQQLTSSEA